MYILQFFFLVLCRLLDTRQHTHLQTVDGMKPLAALKAVRPQGPPPAHACGTPLQVTRLLEPQLLVGIHPAMPLQDMVALREVCARTAGTKPLKPRERPQDMVVAGLKHHVPTEEMSQWKRLQLQGPAKGSLGGMRPLLVRWDPQHHY